MESLKKDISPVEKKAVMKSFGKHFSKGQIKAMRAAHIDFLETRRTGSGFTDAVSGRRIIDCFTSAGCFNVGRGNREVIAALAAAARDCDMGTGILPSRYKIGFAKKLASMCPGDLNKVIFTAAGAEAIDCAIKLARGATGRNGVISMIKAYHGHSGYSLSANGKDYYKHYFEPLMPGFSLAPFGDLEAVKSLAGEDTAAIILEPIQGEGGIFVGDDYYLRGLRKLCDDLGIMLIFDEIQTGFGRTGRLFASEHSGVVPDIMTLAKSISGGLFPNSAVIYRDIPLLTGFVDEFPDFHPSWAGGSDLACAAGSATLDFIVRNRLWENAEAMGKVLADGLVRLKEENPKIIREVRGRGLMIGIEYTHEYMGALMSDSLAKQGIFAVYSGNQPQVMRFMLPVSVTRSEMDRVLEIIRAAVGTMKKFLPLTTPISKIPILSAILDNMKVQITMFDWIRHLEDFFGITKRNYGREGRS
jgi:acetylornithine/succinyldiaminopimelate/putrescine aminotransferase